MKTKLTIFAISIMVLLFCGCKKTKDLSDVTFSINNESITVGTNTVKFTADYSYSGMVKSIVMEISEKEDMGDIKTCDASISGNSFEIKVSGLKPLTIYYYRIKSDLGYDIFIGDVKKIQTNDYSVPIVSTANTSEVTAVSVKCSGELLDDGGLETTEKGFCCSKFSNPTIDGIHVVSENNTDVFTATITGLEINVKYYIRAYAKNSKGVGYGNEISFTTLDGKPIVTTNAVTDISFTTASCGGNVTDDAGFTVTERGVCWGTSENPTINNSHIVIGTGTGSFSSSITNLVVNTTYYVRAYATNCNGTSYGVQQPFKTLDPYNGHGYVDLSLPSGLLWATCNVGANSPEDYGEYYAWGETATKSQYDWNTYKWCNGSSHLLTKYCTTSGYGNVDNKKVLDSDDDAANVNWGGGWRMPTKTEMEELKNNCNWTWTTENGINGYKVTSKKGNSIFLPAAGYSYYGPESDGYKVEYWTSSLYSDYSSRAYSLSSNVLDFDDRSIGRTVRPVCRPIK